MIIEGDGGIHSFQKEYDEERDTKLFSKDLKVFRIQNELTIDQKTLEILIKSLIKARVLQLAEY